MLEGAVYQLEHYFFTEICVRANPDFNHSEARKTEIRVAKNFIKDKDDPGRYGVAVRVSTEDSECNNTPYFFAIETYGYFRDEPDDIKEDSNCHEQEQLLISAIREKLISLTARGPWGRYHFGHVLPPENGQAT